MKFRRAWNSPRPVTDRSPRAYARARVLLCSAAHVGTTCNRLLEQKVVRRQPWTHGTALANLLLAAGCLLTPVGTAAAQQGYPPPPGSYDSEYTPPPHRAEARGDTMQGAQRHNGGSVLPGSAPPLNAAARTEPLDSSTRFSAPPPKARRSDDPSAAAAQAARRSSAYAEPAGGFVPTPPNSNSPGGDYRVNGFRPSAAPSGPDHQSPPAYPGHQALPGRAAGHGAGAPAPPGRPAYPAPAGPATVRSQLGDSTTRGFYPGPVDTAGRPSGSPQAADGAAVFRPVD